MAYIESAALSHCQFLTYAIWSDDRIGLTVTKTRWLCVYTILSEIYMLYHW